MTSKPNGRRKARQFTPAAPGWRRETVERTARPPLGATIGERVIEKQMRRLEAQRGE